MEADVLCVCETDLAEDCSCLSSSSNHDVPFDHELVYDEELLATDPEKVLSSLRTFSYVVIRINKKNAGLKAKMLSHPYFLLEMHDHGFAYDYIGIARSKSVLFPVFGDASRGWNKISDPLKFEKFIFIFPSSFYLLLRPLFGITKRYYIRGLRY